MDLIEHILDLYEILLYWDIVTSWLPVNNDQSLLSQMDHHLEWMCHCYTNTFNRLTLLLQEQL